MPETVATLLVSSFDPEASAESRQVRGDLTGMEPAQKNVIAASRNEVSMESQRMLNEIEASKLLQEEIGARENVVETITTPTKIRMGARVIEKQRMTHILVAKSMLEEELAKYVRDESTDIEIGGATEIVLFATTDDPIIIDTRATIANEIESEATREVVFHMDERGENEALSIGNSDKEEEGSDGFSQSGSSSSRGESTLSRGSRKRPADESPEREPNETSRRNFPGTVTRSEGGCRIYVPPVAGVKSTELGATVPVSATDEIVSLRAADEIVAVRVEGKIVPLRARMKSSR